jgi:hypothetical protein
MTAIATIDWNAKVNEALERAEIMVGSSRHFYFDLGLEFRTGR